MDFDLSDDHRMLRDTVRDFARKEVAPGAAARDKSCEIPQSLIRQMAQMGLLGICVPTEYGGAGMDTVASSIVVEEISRACAGCGVFISAHNSLCIDPVLTFASEAQKKKYLPALASGEAIGCFSLTEPGSGSDAGAARCTAKQTEDGCRRRPLHRQANRRRMAGGGKQNLRHQRQGGQGHHSLCGHQHG